MYLNPLYLIRRDTNLSSIDWCDYIVDCLVRTKKVYNPEKKSFFFYGPAAYLMVQSGGFGCGHVNEAYVEEEFQESEYNEEESGGDEVESDGEEDLCDEDEEDFDVNKVSDVEIMIKGNVLVVRGGSGPHEGNIGKNHVEGKGDDDEDDEQGNGSGCNKEEAMNLNSVVENVTKSVGLSVGLIDSQEGVSFSQFICDPVVESFLKTLDQVEDDVNLNLTGIDDAKKDGEGEDVEDCSNKNKNGSENVEDCSNKNKDSNETRSLKNVIVPSFSLGFSQDFEGSKKSSQSQIYFERMTKKKIKDRVILGKPSAGPECVIPNVDVIDASPVSFAPLWTLSFEYTHLNETAKYKVFKDSFSRSVSGDRDLKVLKDVDMVFFPVLRHKHIYLIVMNMKKRVFEVIDNGADDVDFDDKYGAILNLLYSKDLLCSMEIIFLSNGGRVLGVSYNLYENLARNMKNKNLGKWGT
ncbi:unnamed protein product [Lactuca virosa]|uniref:Ubiquitin-like protease family profile domain-containing protein n=1 Tax=Lactuca virosa TaxID=75947 RepID=A0AAU9LXI4_9ASTR|nr:unnamed protein product [Lactuca virosa]